MVYDLILKNSTIINKEGKIKQGQNIYISQGEIIKISDEFINANNIKEIIDCSNLFVTPGLVNLHTHSPMNIFKGIAEDVDIYDWFNKEIWPYESKITSDDVYYGALLAIIEMIENGVTAFADHYFYAERICDAVLETGIRGDIAPTLFGMADNFEDEFKRISHLIEKKSGISNRLSLRYGPHSPYTCPLETLKKIVDAAKYYGVGLHIHMSETVKQVEDSFNTYNKTHFEILYDAGGFDVPIIIAHGIWLSERDLRYLSNTSYFAVSPKTYMKLSMGMGNIWKYYKQLKICIATDGAASPNSLNPLEQARLFALLGKLTYKATEYRIEEIWEIMMKGHEALNFNTGDVEIGYKADLVFWDLNKPNTMPVYNPLASIIYSADSRNIIHVMVNGVFLKRNGKLLIDTDEIIKKAYIHSKKILERGKGYANIYF